jgi:hypothetical protein
MYITFETDTDVLISLPIGSFGYDRVRIGANTHTDEPEYRASLFGIYLDIPLGVTKESYDAFNQRLLEML